MKDLRAWQLEQSCELCGVKEKLDETQEMGVVNRTSNKMTSLDLKSLESRVGVLELQGNFVVDRQTEDRYHWENMFTGN